MIWMKKCLIFLILLPLVQCGPIESQEESQPSPLLVTPTLPVEREPHTNPKLLLIGDSLASNTAFSQTLITAFQQFKKNCQGINFEYEQITSFALPSSSPRHFVARSGSNKDWLCRQKRIYHNGTKTDQTGQTFCSGIGSKSPLEKLIEEETPTDLVIALGTNSLAFNGDYIVEKVTDMLSQLPEGSRCFWVAPTYVSQKYHSKIAKVEAALTEALDTHTLTCQLVKTFDEMKKQTQCSRFYVSDGIHHTSCGSQLWGETVFDKICADY